ncbi:M24 family metallopeptidase [Nitrospinota bacterium]
MESQSNFWPWFSEEEYERRYARIRAAMEEKNLDCLIFWGYSTAGTGTDLGQTNITYITSFASTATYLVFPLNEEPTIFVTMANHVKNAKRISHVKDVRAGSNFFVKGGMGSMPLQVAGRLKELGLEKKRIGMVGNSAWLNINFLHDAHVMITEALPDAEFETVTAWYEGVRLIKSEEEVALMRRVTAMTDAAYEVMVRSTRPGIRPIDLHNIYQRAAQAMDARTAMGHVGRTPMSDPDMNYPDYIPLTTPIQVGDVIMTEMAVGIAGYFGKIWGTYFVGDPTPEYEKLFNLAKKTSDDLHAAIKPGVKTGDLARLCLDTIQDAGYMSKTSICGWSNRNARPEVRAAGDRITDPDFVFEKNQCINVVGWPSNEEATIGLWLGDCCVITDDGIENLQKYPIRELHDNIIK